MLVCLSGVPFGALMSADALKFSVTHSGLALKITLDSKWQTRSLLQSVVGPFVKAFNKKRSAEDAISDDSLLGMLADDAAWIDPAASASALPAGVSQLALYFNGKTPLTTRACRVTHGEVSMRIEIEPKWLRQPFKAAVVVPFTLAYNKKDVPSILVPEEFSLADVDGERFDASEAAKPT